MTRSQTASIGLLAGGGMCITAGMFVMLGLGAALVTAGVLLVAAEWLVR